ncbi:T6SS effector BTH_I2691 family protein [Variovorax sp. IB41]|uniref:T6SS effector BTH_I2691 family protein n=1 Tax=Variovorax sp. IB41 TaxID=2779370 RepID=UPI0018E8852E|nr:T6SS effector BTH_I2691 family protein [Variovorax sp. IB41]MBJ2159867.1 hypothetical protein [Variovorax sp. IB41]
MATSSQCRRCDKSGLSILLVRPTAIAKDSAFAPADAGRLLTHDAVVQALRLPRIEQSRYALRLLRQGGYVYVYYPAGRPQKLRKSWEGYRVSAQGAMLPEGEFVFDKTEAACSRKSTHPHDLRTICIEEPKQVGTVWIGFSMNWWSDKIKAVVAKDPGAAGMVKVDLGSATQPSGLKAEAALIGQHVADYVLADFTHANVESATPFYPAKAGEAAAVSLTMVMRKQAEASPDTKDKELVLAIPDPAGLAADLNGIRIAKDKALKEALANSTDARALASDAALRGLEEAIRAVAAVRAQNEANGSTSESAWNKIKDSRYVTEGGYRWEPSSDGSKAADGSLNGQIINPPDARRERAIAARGKKLGESDWAKIGSQLDEARRNQLVARARNRVEEDGRKLEPYEADWLKAMKSISTLKYFECHFDEDEPNRVIAPVSPGEIYCSESSLVHLPQPLSSQRHYKEYLEHLLDKPVTDKQAVALRAMFGNQKVVIEQINGLLAGDADRGNSDNMRDKTYDMLKGLFTLEGGKKYSWMTDAVAAFAGGHQTALGAAAFLLLRGNPAQAATYLQKLPKLAVGHNTLLMAIETAVNGGEPNMAILVERRVTAAQAIKRVAAAPKDQYSQRDRTAFNQNDKRVLVLELSDVNTESGAVTLRPGEAPRMQGYAKGAPSTKAFEAVKERAKSLNAVVTTESAVERVQQYRKIEAANLVAEGRIDQRLGIGGMIVQAIGLYQALPVLFKELNGPGGEKLRDAALSVADGVSGFTGATADMLAGAHKAALMEQAAGRQLIQMSTKLAVLKTVAGLAGVAGGALNAVMSAYKAEGAEKEGDTAAFVGYRTAQWTFIGTSFTSAYVAGDAASGAAISRFIARRVVLRAAGVVAAEALAATAGTVAAVVSGVGLVLLIVGIGATVFAIVTTRTELQRWAARSYFGKDSGEAPRFKSAAEEDAELVKALGVASADEVKGSVLLERDLAPEAASYG